MTDHELADLVQRGESDRVEWKQSSRDREDVKRTLCAMANNLSGAAAPLVIAIGIGPDGAVTPTPLTDELSQLLTGFRDEGNIVPRPSYSVRQLILEGQPVTVLLVTPAVAPPLRLRGRVYYWFDDRVEVHSPGGPFGLVNERNFGQPGITDYRNPHLAEAMKVLGFVQRFGAGIPIAQRACADNGNPPPEFHPSPEHVVAVVKGLR